MPIYHVKKGLPDVELPVGEFPLIYSNHALQQKNERQLESKHSIPLPQTLNTRNPKVKVIEIETHGYGIVKILYKVPVDKFRNLLMAIKPIGTSYVVKTLWMVPEGEKKSIDLSRYADPKSGYFKPKDLF